MSFTGIASWSLLCGAVTSAFTLIAGMVAQWSNEYAFKDMTTRQEVLAITGAFLLGTIVPLGLLLKIKWTEQEGPAKIADEIERKLRG